MVEQRPLPCTTLDITDKVIQSSRQYCAAGGFADVYECPYNDNDGVKKVAVKVFRFKFCIKSHEENGDDKVGSMIGRELGIWKGACHPNIVPFLGITYGLGLEGSACLVSSWMTNGTLRAFLENYSDDLTDPRRLKLLLEVSNGLSYLHSLPIVHGDLSCNNVLLDDDYTARLVDFGLSPMVEEIPEALVYLHTTTRGPEAIRWAAPEHFSASDIKRTTKSDIYSLGNLIFLLLSGKFPWSEVKQDVAVMLQLSQGRKPARPESRPIQDVHWALIEQCWSSVERPPVQDVVSSLETFHAATSSRFP